MLDEAEALTPIMAELRAIREEYAAPFNYDVAAMFRDMRAKQEAAERETAQNQPTSGVDPEPSGHDCSVGPAQGDD